MKLMSDNSFPPEEVGSTVLAKIPDVDRSKGDLSHVVVVLMENKDNEY